MMFKCLHPLVVGFVSSGVVDKVTLAVDIGSSEVVNEVCTTADVIFGGGGCRNFGNGWYPWFPGMSDSPSAVTTLNPARELAGDVAFEVGCM